MSDTLLVPRRPRVTYGFVGGILDPPDDGQGFGELGVAWVNRNLGPGRAWAYEYFSLALMRRLFGAQRKRAAGFASLFRKRGRDGDNVIAAHSNGAEVVVRALAGKDLPIIRWLHLFSPACDPDMDANGLNLALETRRVGNLTVWIAKEDRAMKAAWWSRFFGGWLGLGYGLMGRDGPTHILPEVADRVSVVPRPGGHSRWHSTPAALALTMRAVSAFDENPWAEKKLTPVI